MNTIDYYNQKAKDFANNTCNVEFKDTQDKFLEYLNKDTYILDLGCGSGRDTKYFLDKGYRVDAVDGSKELCLFASKLTGIEVKNMMFQELDENEKYDGIFACASLLHLKYDELTLMMPKLHKALKNNGYIYMSYKYGDFEGERNGRYFTDMNEERFHNLIDDNLFNIEKMWISKDARKDRGDEMWLNVIMKKN